MKENNVGGRNGAVLEARQTTSIAEDKSSYSGYAAAAGEAVEREHSEHIPSAFPHHDPFQNSDSSASNSFGGGHFESFQQSLRQGEGQGLFGFSNDKSPASRRSPPKATEAEGLRDRHQELEAGMSFDRQEQATADGLGHNFYSDINSATDDTGFVPSHSQRQTPQHGLENSYGHKTPPFSKHLINERDGSVPVQSEETNGGSGINYNINHGDFGNSYFESAGADEIYEKPSSTLASRHNQERFDLGGFEGENSEVGFNHYSPDNHPQMAHDKQPQLNYAFTHQREETMQQQHEGVAVAHATRGKATDAQRSGDFKAEESEYVQVDYRTPIQKLGQTSAAAAIGSATNYHSLRLAAPATGTGARRKHERQHSGASHDHVHPHDGPFHFSEPPVEGTANEEYRKHAAEHTSFMTEEEQKELDMAFARLKERKRLDEGTVVSVSSSSPTTRFTRQFTWF